MFRILYICTHNRCRSVLSEAVTNHLANGRILAKSAGSQPVGEVHPLSIKYLQEYGACVKGLSSQSWDEFEDFAADLVITVCDSAAGEVCPVWFGNSLKVHWGLTDPSKLEANDQVIAAAFRDSIGKIESRIAALLALPLENMSRDELKHALQKLGAK